MGKVFISIEDIEYGDFKWIDTRFSLKDASEGKKSFMESHVLGAVHWDLNEDLSDLSKQNGRHPMPEKESLIELFRSSGLELGNAIAVYDDGGSPFAARAWWLLQYAGFKKSFILLEGFERIYELGIPVTKTDSHPERSSVTPDWDESLYASRDYVQRLVTNGTAGVLLDAREAKRYRGEIEPLDKVAGRIPGALNFDWEQVKKNDVFQLDESLKENLEKVVDSSKEVTVYCGSGVTAAPVYAMLKHFGYVNARLYVGSFSDWISKESAEVEKG